MAKWIVSLIILFTVFDADFADSSLCSLEKEQGKVYHVSIQGNDANDGSPNHPMRNISAAAQRALPGDTITVHEGIYREYINPPRGGESDQKRITYQAAYGESVIVKGSELVMGWQKIQNDTWRVVIPNTFFGGFNPYKDTIHGDWFNPKGRTHHTGAVYLNNHWLTESASLDDVLKPADNTPLWFAQADDSTTTIWAQFKNADPKKDHIEINVRQSVFYPANPGVNYITVRGFTLMHAATPWSPPTAQQIGLIGTHWSKGWIIENNDIRYSTCVGVSLGKHGDQWDNTSQDSAQGYLETIDRARQKGWSKDNIGSHIVRNNRIANCEQAGIVASLGAVFSSISGNVIHDIHVRRLFTGDEMAGIKIHAAVDVEISHNHIYRTCRGIWLDWMAQGTRVTANLFHDNAPDEDLYVEVNHGPFVADNNIFLSAKSLFDKSQGGAYLHNLFAGTIRVRSDLKRFTPFLVEHSTESAGVQNIGGGDNRFYNNLMIQFPDLTPYDKSEYPSYIAGNLFLLGAKPSKYETKPLILPEYNPKLERIDKPDGFYLTLISDKTWLETQPRTMITTEYLGKTKIANLPYVKPDGSPYHLDTDYFGRKRNSTNPFPGPFEISQLGQNSLNVWPSP